MANTSSAKKSALQNEKRRQRNAARRSAIKTAIKKVLVAVEENSNQTQEFLLAAISQLARAKSKGLIHANTAARKISRLTLKYNSLQKEAQ